MWIKAMFIFISMASIALALAPTRAPKPTPKPAPKPKPPPPTGWTMDVEFQAAPKPSRCCWKYKFDVLSGYCTAQIPDHQNHEKELFCKMVGGVFYDANICVQNPPSGKQG